MTNEHGKVFIVSQFPCHRTPAFDDFFKGQPQTSLNLRQGRVNHDLVLSNPYGALEDTKSEINFYSIVSLVFFSSKCELIVVLVSDVAHGLVFFFQDKNRNFDSNCYAFRIFS